jgi:hypothetical protein
MGTAGRGGDEAVSALEPTLTALDRQVLAALPEAGESVIPREVDRSVTVWQVGERLDIIELFGTVQILLGLAQLGYAETSISKSRNRSVWWRTPKGDAAVDQRPAEGPA